MPEVANDVASPVNASGANADQIIRRLGQMKSERSGLETIYRECYDMTYPLRGSNFWVPDGGSSGGTSVQGQAAIKQAELLDSTGTEAARILTSALMSGLTPKNSRWAESWVQDADEADKTWLDESSTTVWEWIHRSNYDSEGFECLLDCVIAGTFALYIDELPQEEGGGYVFEQFPLASTWFSASKHGRPIDTFYREMWMTAEQSIAYYGEDKVDKTVRDAAKTEPLKKFCYVWAIYPRPGMSGKLARNMPFASCHVEVTTKRIVRERGYHECPIVCPRWQKIPQSVYANGPVFEALPTIKQLNAVIRLNMAGLEMNVAGMWIAKDDGVLNPNTVKVGPRKIIIAADTDSLKPLIDSTDMSKTIIEIERLQKQIRGCMMADHLDPPDRPGDQQTAYEFHVRVDLIRQLLGPTYGRLETEFLSMMWKRCWGLAYRAGTLGMAPPNLRGREFTVKYVSPLARAQRGVDLTAMDRYEASTLEQSQLDPSVVDNYDIDEANRLRSELGGVPQKLMRKREDVQAMRAKAGADQQQQEQKGFGQEALLEHIKGGGENSNALAMAAIAQAMQGQNQKPTNRRGRQIVAPAGA